MGGTGPSAGPPALKRLPPPEVEVGAGLGELAEGVVGAGEGEEGAVKTGVVVCCASTMGGASHVARSPNPVAKTTRATTDNFSKARVRSVISPPCASLTYAKKDSASGRFSPQRPRSGRGRRSPGGASIPSSREGEAKPPGGVQSIASAEISEGRPPPDFRRYATWRTRNWATWPMRSPSSTLHTLLK